MGCPSIPDLIAATTCAIVVGSLADRLIGDPRRMPHLVRGIGRLISAAEQRLRPIPVIRTKSGSPADHRGLAERSRGTLLVTVVLLISAASTLLLLVVAYWISIWLGILVEAILCFQCLAVKSLHHDSTAVQSSLEAGALAQARQQASMIVGRDTDNLDAQALARAGVETVAENTSDAVVAPLMAMMVAGGVGGVVCKAVNTMDSMIGYRDERYIDFGRSAARLDDCVNWVPSRIAACLMIAAAWLTRHPRRSGRTVSVDNTGNDWRQAVHIWCRDRRKHSSPNSAQTESVCAGALNIQLGGPATYGGKPHDKPALGDPIRPICASDIARANTLMSMTGWLALVLVAAVRVAVWGVIIHATQ